MFGLEKKSSCRAGDFWLEAPTDNYIARNASIKTLLFWSLLFRNQNNTKMASYISGEGHKLQRRRWAPRNLLQRNTSEQIEQVQPIFEGAKVLSKTTD